jgi:hypothetical protein
MFTDAAAVCITTYTMIAYSGRRSEDAEKVHALALLTYSYTSELWHVSTSAFLLRVPVIYTVPIAMQVMQQIQSREWGLILLDEVSSLMCCCTCAVHITHIYYCCCCNTAT